MENRDPVIYDLGEFQSLSGTSIRVYAKVLIDIYVEQVPLAERGPFIDDILPRAMVRLREQLSTHLPYTVRAWIEPDSPEPET